MTMSVHLLHNDLWKRRGISLLWDADQLASLCKPSHVISLREFLRLHADGWPEASLALINERALIVAGLESCIDALPPEEAGQWLENSIYPAIVSYQGEVASGGDQASLIFWVVDHGRLKHNSSDDVYYWHCGTEYQGQQIPLSRCLFNGAYRDVQRIVVTDEKKNEHFVGLYHPRIS